MQAPEFHVGAAQAHGKHRRQPAKNRSVQKRALPANLIKVASPQHKQIGWGGGDGIGGSRPLIQ
jgi:hypothetical protein